MDIFDRELAARNAVVARLVALLASGEFERVIEAAPNSKVGAAELRTAVAECGHTLVPLPEHASERIDYIAVLGSEPPAWSVVAPLFTIEEGLSDLSLELTLVASDGGAYEVQVDNLHVR